MSTATSVPGLRVGPVLGRRACAALALTSAGLHAAMLGHASNVVAGGLLAAMIVACVYCARDLWLRGTLRAWCAVGLMNIAMIAVHMPMPAHHHGIHASRGPAVDADGSGDRDRGGRGGRCDGGVVLPHARERAADQR